MAYLVFARKWRPVVFEDVVGQEHITDTLKRAIEKERVAHAYIFTGTRGVGKTTTARIMARALNCENGPTPNPCGTCENCRAIVNGNSFDVIEIDGASNNGVDNIRELRENIAYTSMGGKYRVFVIDEVHMLTTGAFNALLKTLEEPPENVIFIFATTEPHKIPDTIHSRCQRFDFRAISEEAIMRQLQRICHTEKITFEDNALRLIAHKAGGSMRDSLSLLDQAYSFCGEHLEEKVLRSVLGMIPSETYHKILEAMRNHKTHGVLSVLDDVLNTGYDLTEFVNGLLEYLRGLLFVSLPGVSLPGNTVAQNNDEHRTLQSMAAHFSENDILRMCEMTAATDKELRFSSLPRFAVERLLVRLATMDSTVTVSEILTMFKNPPQPDTIPAIYDDTPPPIQEEEPHVCVSTPTKETELIPSETFRSRWQQIIQQVQASKSTVADFLERGKLVQENEDNVNISFLPIHEFQQHQVSLSENRKIIEGVLANIYQKNMTIHFTVSPVEDVVPVPPQEEKQALPTVPQKNTRNNDLWDEDCKREPIIQQTKDIFKAILL